MGKQSIEATVTTEKVSKCKDNNCTELLQLIVDGEATPEQETYFKEHIDECVFCFDNYQVERGMKQAIKEKIAKMNVPAGLQESILSKIRESV